MDFNPAEIDKKWQKYWAENQTYAAQNNSEKPKFYVLDMFPYPSGAGLHVGHPLGYIASDIYARFKRHKGFNVLHPMGYDSFGLPAEQYAIQTGQHPAITTEQNIARYREQLDKIGFSFDWSREVRTSNPEYYRWTQWIFKQLFDSWYNKTSDKAEDISTLIAHFEKHGTSGINAACGVEMNFSASDWTSFSEREKSDALLNYRLAYRSESMVNWCPALGTVLANDEVKDGVSERGGHPVIQKKMMQWSMRISAYAQRLLDGLDTIDWSESIKESQRNWIGRSEGCAIRFKVESSRLNVAHETLNVEPSTLNSKNFIEIFTTRPETIFGATYMTLAPEHELVDAITTAEHREAVAAYKVQASKRSERDRMADTKTITGQFTGAFAINPFTKKEIPIWIGDYVLAGYGTGAVMAVPGHDSRDWAFAKHFSLPIEEVVKGGDVAKESYDAKEGTLVNSGFLNGLEVKAAMKTIIAKIEEMGIGKGRINYRLRDAIFGRQRYWGEPIPVYYVNDIPKLLPDENLPLVLPEVDKYLPTEDGEPPLARAENFTFEEHEIETTTMPGWAGSSWYFLRYMDPHNETEFVSKKAVDYWQNVDLYVGGSEHATGHLLYARFWHKFFADRGWVNTQEPFKKLVNQGMIQGVSAFVSFLNVSTSKNDYSSLDISIDDNLDDIDLGEYLEQTNAESEQLFFHPRIINNLPYRFKDRIPIDFTERKGEELFFPITSLDKLRNSLLKFKNARLGTFADLEKEFPNQVDPSWKHLIDANRVLLQEEVEKMSKSKYNVVSPDDLVEKYGADVLRMYEMFLGPIEQSKPWNTQGMNGVSNFLRKLWRLFHSNENVAISEEAPNEKELKTLHTCIKKVNEDIEAFSFNTSVSAFMICVNELTDLDCNKREILEPLTVLLAPFAPHIAEELWAKLGHTPSVTQAPYPIFNPAFLTESTKDYPVSFNGKVRFNLSLPATMPAPEVEKAALADERTAKYLDGKSIKKIIVVPGKIVNVVLG